MARSERQFRRSTLLWLSQGARTVLAGILAITACVLVAACTYTDPAGGEWELNPRAPVQDQPHGPPVMCWDDDDGNRWCHDGTWVWCEKGPKRGLMYRQWPAPQNGAPEAPSGPAPTLPPLSGTTSGYLAAFGLLGIEPGDAIEFKNMQFTISNDSPAGFIDVPFIPWASNLFIPDPATSPGLSMGMRFVGDSDPSTQDFVAIRLQGSFEAVGRALLDMGLTRIEGTADSTGDYVVEISATEYVLHLTYSGTTQVIDLR